MAKKQIQTMADIENSVLPAGIERGAEVLAKESHHMKAATRHRAAHPPPLEETQTCSHFSLAMVTLSPWLQPGSAFCLSEASILHYTTQAESLCTARCA